MKNEIQGLVQTNAGGGGGKSIKDTVLMYLYYWPLFLVSLLLGLGAGYIILRYTVPLYAANTVINVKGETTNSRSSSGSGDLITSAMQGGRSAINLDNELGRLRSARLMTKVVRNSDLNISYYRQGRFIATDIYHDAPFRLVQKEIQDSSQKIKIKLSGLSSQGATIEYGDEENPITKQVTWNQQFAIQNNVYQLAPLTPYMNPNEQYTVVWSPVLFTVYELIPKVSVGVIGKTNNIGLNITIENARRGEDVLNRMVEEFKQMNLEDQNQYAQDKIFFIQDRLTTIAEELRGAEKTIANYQGDNLMVGDQANTVGTPIGQAQKEIDNINNQKSLISVIKGALNSPEGRVLPTAGISDGALSSLVGAYNENVLKRQSLATQVAPNSMLLKDLDDKISNLRNSISDNLANNIQALNMQANTFSRQSSQFRASVSVLPQQQRILNDITREKNIKESLYMYLLQKREETALSKSKTSPYEQIDLASSYGPVSPDKKGTFIFAGLLGLAFPVAIIFLLGMLNDKVSGRDEVEKVVKAQVVGEINNIKRKEDQLLPSLKGGIIGEQFRIMRANLNFLQQQTEKPVILITSSASGEGKSFVSLNTAAVLAKTGKRVALLDFDLRKPDDSLPGSLNGKGIKDYLLGEARLDEIAQQVGEVTTLHLFPSGNIIAEVGDLILSEHTDKFFEELTANYDAIVINTPPVALVGDALILQKYSTIVGFVIREGKTKKKHLRFLNSLIESRKFTSTCIIYNGVKTGMKYGYYGYGYTKNNAYFDRDGKNRFIRAFKKKKSPVA